MALTLAAAAIGCNGVAPAVAGPPPPGSPPPPGGPGGFPPVPPPRSPIAMLRSSFSSYAVRGCCGVTAVVAWGTVWVVVCIMVVIVSICDKLFFVIAKNGVGVIGVSGVRGSFSMAGLLRIAVSRGSCSGSDSLLHVCVGTLTS